MTAYRQQYDEYAIDERVGERKSLHRGVSASAGRRAVMTSRPHRPELDVIYANVTVALPASERQVVETLRGRPGPRITN